MQLIPASPAIVETSLDFGKAAKYAQQTWPKKPGLSKNKQFYWEGTCLHFLTESIQPKITSPRRPKVMLLFSNPHPESVKRGLFVSESRSTGFWNILSNSMRPKMNHEFRWDLAGINETASMLLNGNYEGPLLFLECLYQIPSVSPKDLKYLFNPNTDDFQRYLHRPSLERICSIINKYNIKVVLVFTGETYESIVDRPGISKGSREVLYSCVKDTKSETLFWECLDRSGLRDQARLPSLKHGCAVIKVMDTRAKDWRKVAGRSVFSHVVDYGLQYALDVG